MSIQSKHSRLKQGLKEEHLQYKLCEILTRQIIDNVKDAASSVIFTGMGNMYWSDWSWGWQNWFYIIGLF